MTRRVTLIAAAATLLAVAACPGGLAARARPVASLSASPARVALTGSERTSIALRNFGSSPLTIAASLGGLVVDLRGRPALRRADGHRSAARWLRVRPRDLVVRPGAAAVVDVTSRVPARAEPGDHHAVVLFTTRAPRRGAVGIRMRLAVRVVVRAPGRIVRRVRVRSLNVQRLRGSRVFAVRIANRGNVTETIGRGRLTVTLLVRGREAVRLAAGAREVLPGADAIVRLRYSGRLRGPVVARVAVVGGPTRTFRARL